MMNSVFRLYSSVVQEPNCGLELRIRTSYRLYMQNISCKLVNV